MKKAWIVVADLGLCKVYKLGWTRVQHTPRLRLVEEFALVDAHGKLLDKLTDQAGRYRVPMSRMAMSYGERQKIRLEMKRRLIKQLADHLNQFFKAANGDALYFAANKEIHHQLLRQIQPAIRAKVARTVAADLTKTPKEELPHHLLSEPALTEAPPVRTRKTNRAARAQVPRRM